MTALARDLSTMEEVSEEEMGVPPRVLVVDDEPQVIGAIRDLLEADFEVEAAGSGKEALHLLDSLEVDVILSDQRMPELAGDEFLSRARRVSAATRVLITGYADIKGLMRAVNDGKIFGYVTKPWEPTALLETVAKAAAHARMEKELQRGRRLLDTLMDESVDLIYFKDAESRYCHVNRALARAYGLDDPREAMGKTDFDFFDEGEAWAMRKREKRLMAGAAREADRTQRLGRRVYSVAKVPVFDRKEQPEGLFGIARDITDRKRAEEREKSLFRLREQVWKMRQAEEAGRLLERAEATLAAHGFPVGTCRVRLGAGAGAGAGALEVPFSHGAVVVEGKGLDGADRHYVGQVAEVLSEAFRRADDLTALKEKEEQLQQAQKMEAIGQLAGGIAHDFNNLLTVIMGFCEVLKERGGMDEVERQGLDQIDKAGGRAAELVRHLLAFGRKQILKPEALDLNRSVEGLHKILARLIGADIDIDFRGQEGLGKVMADPSQVDQILMNLAVNARDAMPEGGRLAVETANVELGGEEAVLHHVAAGEYVKLAVRDTGSGMDEETRMRVFEPFFTTKGVGKGTGLGLSTVYGIVKQSEGFVRVDSELGAGTCFEVYLPRVRGAGGGGEKRAEEAGAAAGGHETVLLVDDYGQMRDLVGKMLEQGGYEVLVAADGEEALRLFDQAPDRVDLLLTDLVMPRLGGNQLYKKIRGRRPGMKRIYMSGYAGETAEGRGEVEDGVPFLHKPFTSSQLLGTVRRVLDGGTRPGRESEG